MSENQEQQNNTIPLKQPVMDEKQVSLWRNRCNTANKYHRKQFIEKYKTAKKRYNSENHGFQKNPSKYTHESFNFLYKDIEDFNGSIYYKNPEIDLICRNTEDENEIRNIENLEQIVNDDIKDNRELKSLIRAGLVDEGLAGLGVFYIDYDYRTQDSTELVDPNIPDQYKQIPVANKVRPVKILPENLIRPPYQSLYNYQKGPYLGYIDIVSLECLKSDPTLDQSVVAQLKGKQYADLMDVDAAEAKKDKVELQDDLLYEKIYVVFIKGDDNTPLKRLVIAEDSKIKQPLVYEDYERGNGPDDRGYPIHILALNDPCEGFVPPSEAWILEGILCIIDYLMSKMLKHIKKSKSRTIVKAGKDGMDKNNISKWIDNDDMELLALSNLAPGIDIRSLVLQLTDQELSASHEAMFALAKRVFDELSRKPALAQAAVQEKKKTAEETREIANTDNTQSAYKVDKFKDFLLGFFYDWCKLTQKNMRGTRNISVANRDTGEKEPREVIMSAEQNDLAGSFNADINIETFITPNKELKRRIIKETILDLQGMVPLLGGRKKLNGEYLTQQMLQNVNMRNPEEALIDIPVRNVDQQVMDLATKGIPMSIEDLGDSGPQAIQRLMEIFQDQEMLARLEALSPGISAEDSPIVLMAKDLEAQMQLKNQQKPSKAKSDVGMESAMMGAL